MMRSLGIDPSTTATGLVVLESGPCLGHHGPALLFEDTVKPGELPRLERCSHHAGRMLEVIEQFKPERIVLEGYGLNWQHSSSVLPLVELGTVLRYFLRQIGCTWLEPTPSELKKAVLGRGSGRKAQMMLQVYKLWGFEAVDDNRADAYGLAMIGLAHAGKLTKPAPLLEVARALGLKRDCNSA